MWLLLIVLVGLIWLISRSQANAASGSVSGVDATEFPGGGLSDLMQIPAGLQQAVAQVESGNRQFDSNGNIITSPTGALGIMQLEPATAADLGIDPYDPEQNVAGGTEYLTQLYNKFNGDLSKTLAAYNWGPGNVERADASGAPYPASVQGYIRKVLSLL